MLLMLQISFKQRLINVAEAVPLEAAKKSKSRSVITMKFWIISSQQEMGGKPGWMRFYTIGLKHKPGPVEKQNSISYLMQYLQIVMRMIII
jgi:hypothetical protein